jgi:lipoyl-dependent peroxiredoxin
LNFLEENKMAVRKSSAVWEGGLKDGKGSMKLGSGAYEGPFSFASRFEEGTGTNPEELIGAAHAGCFSMALSGGLGKAGFNPTRIATRAEVTLGQVDGKARITLIHLETEAKVPGIGAEEFQKIAEATKEGCPVSAALAAVTITLTAKLV